MKSIIQTKRSILKYIVPLLFSLIPIIWYLTNGGKLIDGLDTNYPIDPTVWFGRRLFIWNNILNGGGHFSSSVAGLFFHFIQVIPFSLGLSLRNTEFATIMFWFLMVVVAGFSFSRTFISKNKTIQTLFIALYSLNIYMFNTWENIKVSNLALVIGLPLVLVLIKLSHNKSISVLKTVILSFLLGILISGSGINPAYFACILLGGLIYSACLIITNYKTYKSVLFSLFVVNLCLLIVNLFWIVPLVDFLFISTKITGLSSIGFADWLGSLSEHTSLVNVLRLQGAWDWYSSDSNGTPLYIPYAIKYFQSAPFILFSFIAPAIAIASLVFRSKAKRVEYFFFAIILTLGVFFASGIHPPTGRIYLFLVRHLPFFSFFRSPWYIFTPFITLSIASLVAIFFENTILWAQNKGVKSTGFLRAVIWIFVLGHIIYSYPLVTGKIYRPNRSDSFYVNFPDHVYKTQKWLPSSGFTKIATYPDDQLESFNWGYKGTESILNLFSNIEVVSPSFNSSNVTYTRTQNKFYDLLKRGQIKSALDSARIFSIDTLFTKTDTDTIAPNINGKLNQYTNGTTAFGPWTFYKLSKEFVQPKIYASNVVYKVNNLAETLPEIARFIESSAVAIDSRDSSLKTIEGSSVKVLTVLNANVTKKDLQSTLYSINSPKDGQYNLFVDTTSKKGEIDLFLDNVKINDSRYIFYDSYLKVDSLDIKKGEHSLFVKNNQVVDLLKNSSLSIYNSASPLVINSTKVEAVVPNFDPTSSYVLSFEYRYSYGYLPFVNLTQFNGTTKYRSTTIPMVDNRNWTSALENINPVLVNSQFGLTFEPNKKTTGQSLTEIRNISFTKAYDNGIHLLEVNTDNVKPIETSFEYKSPTEYVAKVKSSPNGYLLVFNDIYDSGWKLWSTGYIGNSLIKISANGISNSWYIPVGDNAQSFKIYFAPQTKYQLALFISFILPLLSIIIVFYIQKKKLWNKLRRK